MCVLSLLGVACSSWGLRPVVDLAFLGQKIRRLLVGKLGVILAYMCVKLCVHFGSILGPFRVHFGSILGPIWVHFGSGPIWVHFRSILGPIWVHFGSILFIV